MLITRVWAEQRGDYFCVSTKKGSGLWQDHFFKRRDLHKVPDFIRANRDKNVYFCPHGFSERERLKAYAVHPNVLWSDMDDSDPHTCKIRPTVAIESSPGRFVGLWLLRGTDGSAEEKSAAARFESINRRLSKTIGGDPGGWDYTQVLRMPGTTNYKYSDLPRVRILWSDGPRYSLAQMDELLPADRVIDLDEDSDASTVYKRVQKHLPHWVRRALKEKSTKGVDRSRMLWKLNAGIQEAGVSMEDAFVLLKASVWNKFAGRPSENDQLLREVGKFINKKHNGKSRVSDDDDAPVRSRDDSKYQWLGKTMDEVEEEELDWIWYPYLARGELTLMEGDPGLGKSYIMQAVTGHIIDGKLLPSPQKLPAVKGRVAYFDLENSAGSVTKKRLLWNKFSNLKFLAQEERPFSIDDPDTVEEVMEALEKFKPTLIVFDTLNTYIGKADAFKGHEAQQAIASFREMAKRFNCAVVVLRHLTKSTKERALYRGQGSIAFAGMARVVISVGKLKDDTTAFAVTKFNLGPKPPALSYEIGKLPDKGKEFNRSYFEFGEYMEGITSDDLVNDNNEKSEFPNRDEASAFLKDLLKDGPMHVSRIEVKAEKTSIAWRTVQRAAKELGVVRKMEGFGSKKKATWSMPN